MDCAVIENEGKNKARETQKYTTDTCRKVEPNYKDKCVRYSIQGCEGCFYHGLIIK